MLGVAAASPVISQPLLKVAAAAYRRAFGSIGALAGQNGLRNPRRTAATASALMIGLTLVTTMSIAGSSAKASVDYTIAKNFLGDIVISNAVGQGFSPQIADEAAQQPGVQSVTRLQYAPARLEGERRYLTGVDPTHLRDVLRLKLLAGSYDDLTTGTLLVSKKVADADHYQVGQELTFTFPKGPRKLRVVGIHDSEIAGYVTTLSTLQEGGYARQDDSVLVKLQPGANSADVKAELEHATAKLPVITVKDQREYAAEQRAPIDRLVLIIYALLGLALVIAVLGVVNTLGLSIIERTREIGLLRAIGVDRPADAPDDQPRVGGDRGARSGAGHRDGAGLRGRADGLAARPGARGDPDPVGRPGRVSRGRGADRAARRPAAGSPSRSARRAARDRHRIATVRQVLVGISDVGPHNRAKVG